MNINKTKNSNIIINILTRTSNRPLGFMNCHQSITRQTYKKVKYYVSYENEIDEKYIEFDGILKVKVERYAGELLVNPNGYKHAPYNLYCNILLENIDDGWILFLDDDDHLLHNRVLQELVSEIHKHDEDTIFIWQMRYPNGKVLPTKKHFKFQKIEVKNIDTTCFLFHSKYKEFVKWDEWQASDYRVVSSLYERIPNKKWIEKVYIQKNNTGDFGNRNDIYYDGRNKLIFDKTPFWFLMPKYHIEIFGIKVFHRNTYEVFVKRILKKLKVSNRLT
jgi:hypothetical protein